jgi:hypothetical protein
LLSQPDLGSAKKLTYKHTFKTVNAFKQNNNTEIVNYPFKFIQILSLKSLSKQNKGTKKSTRYNRRAAGEKSGFTREVEQDLQIPG